LAVATRTGRDLVEVTFMNNVRQRLARAATWAATSVAEAMLAASPVYIADDSGTTRLKTILNNATGWLAGILAAVATLFLTIGGIRHLMAGGDPGEIEKAKESFKSAAIGYALAALAPIVVTILKAILGIK
jgi:hypothetical protein